MIIIIIIISQINDYVIRALKVYFDGAKCIVYSKKKNQITIILSCKEYSLYKNKITITSEVGI